jgi:hypothetical protein
MSTLASLDFVPYIDKAGQLPDQYQGKVGVYAIFDASQKLRFIGLSRDIALSLRQHLVRQPQQCYWVKAQTIDRPSRAVLEEIRSAWLAENEASLTDEEKWTQPIQVKQLMTEAEVADYTKPEHDEMAQRKILKNVARRIEAEILEGLSDRKLQAEIRFNPKLKEEGLLDLKA